MTLTLKIDNVDTLEDGGPTWFSLETGSARIGRRSSMDWVLPDPAKHISNHHFEVQFSDGAYWLRDVSTNGVFVQGSKERLTGPLRLTGGERLVVGKYLISATVVARAEPAPEPAKTRVAETNAAPASLQAPAQNDALAAGGAPLQRPGAAAPPATQASPLQHPAMRSFAGRGLQQPPLDTVVPPMPRVDPMPAPEFEPPAPKPEPAYEAKAPEPAPQPQPEPQPEPVALAQALEQQPEAARHAPQEAPRDPAAETILQAFCRGAGLDPETVKDIDLEQLVEDLGQSTRVTAEELIGMLRERASAKHLTQGGERTMLGASKNNPLKFKPDAQEAFATLFLRPQKGFMAGAEGFQSAFGDLRRHQMALFAALQPALLEMMDGLSPGEIEGRETNSGTILSSSKKARSWDTYVQRWNERADDGEHGMVDAFLKAFAKAYAEASADGEGSGRRAH